MEATKIFFKEFREWCKLNEIRECNVYCLTYFRIVKGLIKEDKARGMLLPKVKTFKL